MGKQISLNVKCKKCGKSLMDYKKVLNDRPSIECDIQVENQKGGIMAIRKIGKYFQIAYYDPSGKRIRQNFKKEKMLLPKTLL